MARSKPESESPSRLEEIHSWSTTFPGVGGPITPPEFLKFMVPTYKYQGRTVKKHKLTHQEAYLLAYLLNRQLFLSGDHRFQADDGYYYHTQKDVERHCEINTTSQKRCLRSLELLRVVHVDIRQSGYLKTRYVRVDVERIRRLVEKHKLKRSD